MSTKKQEPAQLPIVSKTTRQINKENMAKFEAEYDKRRAFVLAAVNDLVAGNTTIDQIKADELWGELWDEDKKPLTTLAKAIKTGDNDLIDLVVDHTSRRLVNVRSDAEFALVRWLEKTDKTAYALFLKVTGGSSYDFDEGRVVTGGRMVSHDQYKLIKQERKELNDLRTQFEAEHPNLYKRTRKPAVDSKQEKTVTLKQLEKMNIVSEGEKPATLYQIAWWIFSKRSKSALKAAKAGDFTQVSTLIDEIDKLITEFITHASYLQTERAILEDPNGQEAKEQAALLTRAHKFFETKNQPGEAS